MFDDHHLDLFINELFDSYGFDFGGYSRASFKRRLERVYQLDNFVSFQEFLYKIKNNADYLSSVIEEITVNVTEMFRDASFYKILREEILPLLRTKPFIRIWHAGCSTGQEVYSMAVLLNEEGLLAKSIIYATDLNQTVLESAKKGLFPLKLMKDYGENYRAAGGKKDFSEYYTANYGFAKFDEFLSKKMVFSQHNLVSDSSFNEFDLILCRNVLIYFNKDLQDRVLQLFDDSLAKSGYLALGSKETIRFTKVQKNYEQLRKEKIWKKIN